MIKWIDSSTLDMDGCKITLHYEHGGSQRKSTDSDFTMMKSQEFLERYLVHKDEYFKRILEIGIYQGGSFVFLDKLYAPQTISAIELNSDRVTALDQYVEKMDGRGKIHYSVSQDDIEAVSRIIEEDFDGILDLVIDDASHWYEQTKATFQVAFPKLRPGGLYIIEDWAWSFQNDFQSADHPWSDRNALANLVVDIMEDIVRAPLIDEINVSRHMMKIRRSKAKDGFLVTDQARRGRSLGVL